MSEFNTNLPTVRQVQTYIKDKQTVEIKLNVGEMLEGKVLWQDSDGLCLINQQQQKFLIWKHSIAYIKGKS
jgi:host factor-I protein